MMKPHISFYSKHSVYECKGIGFVGLVVRHGYTPEQAYQRWREAAGYPMYESEPAPVQSETATNALHQHQPAPAPKDWKTRVYEFLKRLVHNHPSR